jgi:hypothetical protein
VGLVGALPCIPYNVSPFPSHRPLIGFNDPKYDCNIMKVYAFDALKKYDFVHDNNKEKRNIQAFKLEVFIITSDPLDFLDVSNFLAAVTPRLQLILMTFHLPSCSRRPPAPPRPRSRPAMAPPRVPRCLAPAPASPPFLPVSSAFVPLSLSLQSRRVW